MAGGDGEPHLEVLAGDAEDTGHGGEGDEWLGALVVPMAVLATAHLVQLTPFADPLAGIAREPPGGFS